ncbi:hypothetical protein DM01DRAFT_183187 [Hesseltinella vesiculosa]|uniref:Uncharacterized protein n=1 Tax=Hesseltinella vesiculosa TaxID=101127 RepID=A0A1X2GU77_9FUNG|nr:hypothetical protein DM01DRAFT_183187 [Hesseltinella vesiculosa]
MTKIRKKTSDILGSSYEKNERWEKSQTQSRFSLPHFQTKHSAIKKNPLYQTIRRFTKTFHIEIFLLDSAWLAHFCLWAILSCDIMRECMQSDDFFFHFDGISYAKPK